MGKKFGLSVIDSEVIKQKLLFLLQDSVDLGRVVFFIEDMFDLISHDVLSFDLIKEFLFAVYVERRQHK
jgi:hypothetical protein